jgi:hypothetical protein
MEGARRRNFGRLWFVGARYLLPTVVSELAKP